MPAKLRGLPSVKKLRRRPFAELTPLEREKLIFFEYRRATQSLYWRALRRGLILERGYRCERCGWAYGKLQLHHRTYERLGHELPADVELLCTRCHYGEHVSGSGPSVKCDLGEAWL
jgi:5-methylcytosine-specific restriction endonuclease McrA